MGCEVVRNLRINGTRVIFDGIRGSFILTEDAEGLNGQYKSFVEGNGCEARRLAYLLSTGELSGVAESTALCEICHVLAVRTVKKA